MTRKVFEGQVLHLILLGVLMAGLYLTSYLPGFHDGSFLGLSTTGWVLLSVGNAILHQIYVWLCWRLELHHRSLTRWLGPQAFRSYQFGFTVLIVLRPFLAFALGWSNRGTLPIDPLVGYLFAALLVLPTAYLVYSIKTWFSFERAYGIDHFDASYRKMPLVRKGIFSWTPNAMYIFGFMALWIPAFLFQSTAALVVAGFSHLYIWVHYFCTERPDMRRIYG